MDLAVAEGHRQRDVVGQALVAQLVRTAGRRTRRPAGRAAGGPRRHPRTARASGCCRNSAVSLDAVLRREDPDLVGAALPVEADAEQLGVQGADVERGARERQRRRRPGARTAPRAGSAPSGSWRASPISQSRIGRAARPVAVGARPPARAISARRRPASLLELAEPRRPRSAPGWCDAGARPARASPRCRSAGTG